jgi:hypothetical protein
MENFTDLVSMFENPDFITGGVLGGLFITMIFVAVILIAAIYVYNALAWQTIARKQKYKRPWLAWIPFANVSMVLQMGSFHWAWVFLFLIPILGWIALFVLWIISLWRIFEKSHYPGWFGLAQVIPKVGGIIHFVIIGIVAWSKPRKAKRKR